MFRVLQIVGSLNMGGAENFVINLYRNIDKDIIQFDFLLYDRPQGKNFYEEVEKSGARIYYVPPKKDGFRKNYEAVKTVVKKHGYQIVWRHTDNCFAGVDIIAARAGGAERLILHSHSTRCNGVEGMLHYIWRPIINCFATERLACGEEAGKWLFGKKSFKVIANGIDVRRCCFRQNTRVEYRQILKLEDKFVIGNVGRFGAEKNHIFLLDIFEEMCVRKKNAVLLLIGDGELQDHVRDKVTKLGIVDKVFFLNTRTDVPEIMQAMDVFCMPSLYEGLPVALIEAQAVGLPCVVSDVITREVDITGNLRFVSLNESVQTWGDVIEHIPDIDRAKMAERVKKAGYAIRDVASEVQRMLCK